MPRPRRDPQRIGVLIRFEPQELVEIDRRRGTIPRQLWILAKLLPPVAHIEALGHHGPKDRDR